MQLNLKISRKNSKGCAAPWQEIRVLSSWSWCTSSPTFYKRRWNVHWMYSPNSTYHRNILSTKKIHHRVLGGSLSEKKKRNMCLVTFRWETTKRTNRKQIQQTIIDAARTFSKNLTTNAQIDNLMANLSDHFQLLNFDIWTLICWRLDEKLRLLRGTCQHNTTNILWTFDNNLKLTTLRHFVYLRSKFSERLYYFWILKRI